MNNTLVLIIVIIGGLAGLAIVAVAFWMMRQESTAGRQDNTPTKSDENDSLPRIDPTVNPAPIEDLTPTPVDWPAQLREAAPPPEPVSVPPVETPPPPALDPVPATQPVIPPNSLNSVAPRPTTTPTPPIPDQELMRVLRSAQGDLVIEVYGQRYPLRSEIKDTPIEQQIANAYSDLGYFLNGQGAEPIRATAPAVPPPLLPPTSSANTPQTLKKEPIDNRPVIKVSLQEAAQMEIKQPSMDIMRQWRYVRDQQKKPVIQIKSVMEEIDEILQIMLIGTPLAERGLKAADGTHGAVFTLDGKNYDTVDALPDPEARELLRTAIQKWDQK